jgi:hypothetical protein
MYKDLRVRDGDGRQADEGAKHASLRRKTRPLEFTFQIRISPGRWKARVKNPDEG